MNRYPIVSQVRHLPRFLLGGVLGLAIVGCENSENAASSPKLPAARVIYLTGKKSQTGLFQGYASNDEKVIGQIESALAEDMKSADRPLANSPNVETNTAVNHVVLFYDRNGKLLSTYDVLGDNWLSVGDQKYYCEATLNALEELVSSGALQDIPTEDWQTLEGASFYYYRPQKQR